MSNIIDPKKYANTYGYFRNFDPVDHENYFTKTEAQNDKKASDLVKEKSIDTGSWCYGQFDPCGIS